jgi:hypothetical protein
MISGMKNDDSTKHNLPPTIINQTYGSTFCGWSVVYVVTQHIKKRSMFKSFWKYLLLLIITVNSAYAHDIHSALFQLSAADNVCFIDIRLDRIDLENAIDKECGISIQTLSTESKNTLIKQYILDRFWMNFDNKSVTYRLGSFTLDQDYISIRGVIDDFDMSNPKKIDVFNTCLIDKVKKHNNLIHVNLNDQVRSFRLNKNRTQTTIAYK